MGIILPKAGNLIDIPAAGGVGKGGAGMYMQYQKPVRKCSSAAGLLDFPSGGGPAVLLNLAL